MRNSIDDIYKERKTNQVNLNHKVLIYCLSFGSLDLTSMIRFIVKVPK